MRPHVDSIFNTLEFVNEYSMVLLTYLMLNFVNLTSILDIVTKEPAAQPVDFNSKVEYTAIAIILFMAVINFVAMIKISVGKLI